MEYEPRINTDRHAPSKIEASLKGLEETLYWLKLLIVSGIVKADKMDELIKDADELIAILALVQEP